MTKKTFEITASKAISVEAVEINGARGISVRQMYKKKGQEEWQMARQGIILPLDFAVEIAKRISKFASSEGTTFKSLEVGKDKED